MKINELPQKLLETLKKEFSDNEINEVITRRTFHQFFNLESIKPQFYKSIVDNSKNILKTKEAKLVHSKLIEILRTYITTNYSKLKTNDFCITNDMNIIKQQFELCEKAIKLSDIKLDLLKFHNPIYKSTKKHLSIVIATNDEEKYEYLKKNLAGKYNIFFIEREEELLDLAHYEQIRFVIGDNFRISESAQELDNLIIFSESDELYTFAPELITDIIEENNEIIQLLTQLKKSLPTNIFNNIDEIDFPSENNHNIETMDFDLKKQEFSKIKAELQNKINDVIRIQDFKGDTILKLMRENKSILDSISQEVKQEIIALKNDMLQNLKMFDSNIITISNNGEVLFDEDLFSKSKDRLIKLELQNKFNNLSDISKKYQSIVSKLPSLVEELYSFDFLQGLGKFIKRFGLNKPEIIIDENNNNSEFEFMYGLNMFIDNPEPIEYYLGNGNNVAVVTGANSGGKTTLLELILQIQILVHMGLFVPVKTCKLSLQEEIYYFAKNTGSVGAGAFESLLKQFARVSENSSKKLILADELEAVTEPGAAVKIISSIIEYVGKSKDTLMVLVTHMGQELSKINVRFDGIEAKGLDENNRLIVERNPVIGKIATSTPHLIIERLAKEDNHPFFVYLANSC